MSKRLIVALTTAAFGVAVGVRALRWMTSWGASAAEVSACYPGDELIADPAGITTMAVTVDAPAEQVWRWLIQIGQDRGGMYSYDWLENLIGLDSFRRDGEARVATTRAR